MVWVLPAAPDSFLAQPYKTTPSQFVLADPHQVLEHKPGVGVYLVQGCMNGRPLSLEHPNHWSSSLCLPEWLLHMPLLHLQSCAECSRPAPLHALPAHTHAVAGQVKTSFFHKSSPTSYPGLCNRGGLKPTHVVCRVAQQLHRSATLYQS